MVSADQISLRELRRTGSVHGPRHKETVLALVEAVEAAEKWRDVYDAQQKTSAEWSFAMQRLRLKLARFKDYAADSEGGER